MILRGTLTEKPVVAVVLAAVLLLAGVGLFGVQMRHASAPQASDKEAFFSVDDGKTWFADDATKIPPFDKDGKQAVLAHVYRGADGTLFVNHLERFKPEARQAIGDANKADELPGRRPDRAAVQNAYTGGREVKRPGAATWVNAANFKDASQVMAVKCPNGQTSAVPVEP